MGLLAGFERNQWEPFVMLGLERSMSDQPVRERRRLLGRLRDNDQEREALTVIAVLNFEAAERRGEVAIPAAAEGREGGRLIAILDWFAEHKEFIQWLIGLFGGLALAPVAPEPK